MKRNVGDLDGRIRSRLGMILILVGVLGFFELVTFGLIVHIVFIIAGTILFITGSSRRCALYSVFGVDTTKVEETE